MPSAAAANKDSPAVDQRALVREMAEVLRQNGADVSYDTFPQHGHGDMVRVSLERALQIAAEP